ncbi:hypothetical protein COA17_14420 [Sphingomonas ginsenosidimutans]|jgi:hypothetical protein|uniref:Phage holin family protein n=1 Tax=Sphingomonas ginsenosidimutans TaxID=862134 RepID=A0A2A4HV45_9SPHN|nr:phage holin family protein [Sphingomonas ginsenosidimutans]MEE2915909.1 phage holin family protein [Pseudomonadota bacterium]PCG08250.1 hypothetical protein COA17_14420 [Sphingomonas ginsenosidimutans]
MGLREPLLEDHSIPHLFARLTSDAREVAQAEIALAKAKVGDMTARYKAAAIYFAVAGVLAVAALIALLVGLIVSLATLIGPGFATLVVVGVTLAVAAALGYAGVTRLSR